MIHEIDKQIIQELRKNARTSLKEVAGRLNLPTSTVHDKVRRFQGTVIQKHSSLLNFRELGYQTHLFLALKTKRDQRTALEDFLKNSKNVNTLYRVNDQFDFLVEAIFKDPKEAQDFLDELKEHFIIENKYIHNVITNLRKEEFLVE